MIAKQLFEDFSQKRVWRLWKRKCSLHPQRKQAKKPPKNKDGR